MFWQNEAKFTNVFKEPLPPGVAPLGLLPLEESESA
jgi:hypothetical protein